MARRKNRSGARSLLGGKTQNQKNTVKWKLRCLRSAESDSEEQRVTRTIGWDTKMLVQFQTQPQTLQRAVWFTWSLNKLVVKGTKGDKIFHLREGLAVTVRHEVPWTYDHHALKHARSIPLWLQTAAEGQAVVPDSSTPKSVSSPEHQCYHPAWNYCQVGTRPAISMQNLGSSCWSFNTHSKVCQNSGFVLLQNHTKSLALFLELSGPKISALWYTLLCRSKATHSNDWLNRSVKGI